MPIDRGSHHCSKSSGFVHASKTRRPGALKVRVTTTSRSDARSTVTGLRASVGSLLVVASMLSLPAFEFLDDVIQRAEARVPQLLVLLDPPGHFLEAARADPARAHPPHLLCGDEAHVLQNADVLLHAG